jgi:hypothetical protein
MLQKADTLPAMTLEGICELPIIIFLSFKCLLSFTPNSPVYEYPLNGQWIMMDIDDGYILWTGIWKGQCLAIDDQRSTYIYMIIIYIALGNSKG